MKVKGKQFKLITILIGIACFTLGISQGFWLKSLYKTIYEQTENVIYDAIRMADYKELFIRMDEVKAQQKTEKQECGEKSSATHFQYNFNETIDDFEKIELPVETNSGETITSVQLVVDIKDEEEEDIIDNLSKYLSVIKGLEDIILSSMHSSIDSLAPINTDRFCTLLEIELEERNIGVPIMLEKFNPADSTFQIIHLTTPNGDIIKPGKNNMQVDYTISQHSIYYRLTLQHPSRIVLSQMIGILLSSLFLSLILTGAYYYLYKTILKQKTEEELKTDFTNNVTHELKTPIAVAMAANDALLNYDQTVNEKQKKYLGIVNEQLYRLTGMVEQILTLSTENRSTFKLKIENVRITELLPGIIEQQKLKNRKDIRVTSTIEDTVFIRGDKTHIHNIFNNLIENAIKYTDTEPVEINITASRKEKEIIISVTDNGMGISEENQKRIFDKFFRVPHGNVHTVKGYGLGLFYIKDTMIKHGGTVSVKSHPGKGSTFNLHFRNP